MQSFGDFRVHREDRGSQSQLTRHFGLRGDKDLGFKVWLEWDEAPGSLGFIRDSGILRSAEFWGFSGTPRG